MYHDGNVLPLKIGDIVLFRPPGGTTERIPGFIISFTPRKVRGRRESDQKIPPRTRNVLRDPAQLILLDFICHKYKINK